MFKLNSVIMLVILCGGFYLSCGEKLQCEFKDVIFFVVGNLYSCKVTSLDNSFNNMTIDGYTGTHEANKVDKDVKAIWIEKTNITFIPANLGSISNLLTLVIQSSQLVQIEADNFLGMQNLEFLSFWSNNLTSIPSNTFSFLPKLKNINLNRNQLSEIPSGLFTNNLKLEQIHLTDNKIKFLGTGVFDGLTKLNIVDLRDNICEINQLFKGTIRIGKLKNKMSSKCKNPNEVPATTTTTSTTTQNPMETEFEALKNELAEAKNEIKKIKFAYEELNATLTNCEANQQKSMKFNLSCVFKMTNGVQYTCETRDLTINHKEMKLNEVIGNHLRSYSNQEVTELIIVKSSMSYWSKDIFNKLPALKTLRIQNAQLNEFKKGDFNSAFQLTVIEVNGNNIAPLGDDVFHGTEEHLTEINLNSNQIEKISAGTFRGLKQLKVLSLKDNLITEIPFGSFNDIVMLEILILTGNKIKYLDGKMLEFNKRLMTLAVDQNKLHEVGEEILNHSLLKDVNLKGNYCIDERTGTDDDDTDGRTIIDLIFVIRNCCKNLGEGLNVYNCGQSGSKD